MKRAALDIRHLEMIVSLAQTSRVTDAAEQLDITPSALSHRIREVERRLDVPTIYTRQQTTKAHRRSELPESGRNPGCSAI